MSQASFFSSRAARTFALILIFGAALAIRLYDLTDLPLDFHPTRQLVSFIKARGYYYDSKPTVFESLVAYTYRFTGEQVWVPRMYSSLFWLIGGIFLFLLARDFVSF